jgi:hypothetical protein
VRYAPLLLLLVGVAPAAQAQGSIFGVRGLGLPGRGASTHAWGMGGALALFDFESAQNPAALASTRTMSIGIQLVPERRSVDTPAGSDNQNDAQFPLFSVAGPLHGGRIGLGITFSNYASRDFQIVSAHDEIIRGATVTVTDTLTSRGGLNDIAVGASYVLNNRLDVGLALHAITGVNRIDQVRVFSDTSYLASQQSGELSYEGFGLSVGGVFRVSPVLRLAAVARSDTRANAQQDSTGSADTDLPITLGAGIQFVAARNLALAGQVMYRGWSTANDDLLAQGGGGAKSTIEFNGGVEYLHDARRPWNLPLRLGVRYAQVPFLLEGVSDQPRELGITIGSGLRFAGQRGGLDVALERTWRSAGSAYKERGWLFVVGMSVRPALSQP